VTIAAEAKRESAERGGMIGVRALYGETSTPGGGQQVASYAVVAGGKYQVVLA
jgi:hypothetical protein